MKFHLRTTVPAIAILLFLLHRKNLIKIAEFKISGQYVHGHDT